jgi:hypothetical protein
MHLAEGLHLRKPQDYRGQGQPWTTMHVLQNPGSCGSPVKN